MSKAHILNPYLYDGDFHTHTADFSDGQEPASEVMRIAHELGYKTIAITDHSQAAREYCESRYNWPKPQQRHFRAKRDNKPYQNMDVIWGVEADIISASGDMCFDIQGFKGEYIVGSVHPSIFFFHAFGLDSKSDKSSVKKEISEKQSTMQDAYISAIAKHHKSINVLAHPTMQSLYPGVNIEELVACANEFSVPLEVNGSYIRNKKMNWEALEYMIRNADQLMINSDGHTRTELVRSRIDALEYMNTFGFGIPIPKQPTFRQIKRRVFG